MSVIVLLSIAAALLFLNLIFAIGIWAAANRINCQVAAILEGHPVNFVRIYKKRAKKPEQPARDVAILGGDPSL